MTAEGTVALVIGAGPAGLMAADRLLRAGYPTIVAEAKPSPARKFLMAGKSGLNLTKDEPPALFSTQYFEASGWISPFLAEFGPAQVADWARALGQPVFTGSSGRVFPTAMKASPLLRAWLAELSAHGLDLRRTWRWTGLSGLRASFDTPEGPRNLEPAVIVLALGGASWPHLGSDGRWTEILRPQGVPLVPFRPANMGFAVDWSAHMAPHFGAPLKTIALIAGDTRIRAEAVLTRRGLEGGGIYAVSQAVRDGASLAVDLFPDRDIPDLVVRLSGRPRGESKVNTLRKALKLTGVRLALALECIQPLPEDAPGRAAALKSVPIPLTGPFPIAEAISTAGGIFRGGLTADLMLRACPGVFAAGEMIDWEAPTGGYLLTACLATGRHAGDAAVRYLKGDSGQDETAAN